MVLTGRIGSLPTELYALFNNSYKFRHMIFILVEIALVPTQNCDHILMFSQVFDVLL